MLHFLLDKSEEERVDDQLTTRQAFNTYVRKPKVINKERSSNFPKVLNECRSSSNLLQDANALCSSPVHRGFSPWVL